MTRALSLEAQVRKLAKGAKAKPLASALGALVRKRLAKPQPVIPMARFPIPQAAPTPATPRRAPVRRRKGRTQDYSLTGKRNFTRTGTWTHYMLDTILDHTDTWSAERAHALAGEYIGKRLDFSWAAKERYITLD